MDSPPLDRHLAARPSGRARGSPVVDDRSAHAREAPRGPAAAAAPPPPAEAPAPEAAPPAVNWTSWSNLWQIPAIVLSLIVIAAGLYVATRRAPRNDFDGALDQVDAMLAAEQFDAAAAQLNGV